MGVVSGAAAGWNVFRLLVMVWRRAPEKRSPGVAAAEVGRDTGAAALAAFRREQPFGWQEEALRQLAEMDERYGSACAARSFASPPVDPACCCRLYSDGSLAQTAVDALRARGWDIPPDLTAVPLFEAPNLGMAQTLVGAADAIALLLPLIGAVLLLLAIWLGRRTPRTLVIGAGALLVAAGLTLIVVNAAGDALTGAAATPAGEVILGSVMAALTDSLWRWVLVVSLIAAGLVLLASVFARRAAAEALEASVTPTPPSTSTPTAPSPPGSASQPAV